MALSVQAVGNINHVSLVLGIGERALGISVRESLGRKENKDVSDPPDSTNESVGSLLIPVPLKGLRYRFFRDVRHRAIIRGVADGD